MKIILMAIILFTVSSCKYGASFSKLKDLEGQKASIDLIYNQELTSENHKVLRNYFAGIKELIYEFKNNENMKKYTHKKFARYFQNSFCEDRLISKDIYTNIMKKCNVSGFYICSEEVRYYTAMLVEAKKLFTEQEMTKILASKVCERKLTALGVINE